jgi:hypothetical protein
VGVLEEGGSRGVVMGSGHWAVEVRWRWGELSGCWWECARANEGGDWRMGQRGRSAAGAALARCLEWDVSGGGAGASWGGASGALAW